MGQLGLQPVRGNRILTLVDNGSEKYVNEMHNSVSTARITLGIDSDIAVMDDLTRCRIALSDSGRATGILEDMQHLFAAIDKHAADYDAVALSTHLERDTDWYHVYFDTKKAYEDVIVNPTGGVEAMMTHSVVEYLDKPCAHAHAPAPQGDTDYPGIFEPRLSPFPGSIRHIHCVLKGCTRVRGSWVMRTGSMPRTFPA